MSAVKQPKPSVPNYQISLRIRHSSIDPDKISEALQLNPEHSFKAGDKFRSRGGSQQERSETYWLASLDHTAWKELWASSEMSIRDPQMNFATLLGNRAAGSELSSPGLALSLWLVVLDYPATRRAFLQRLRDEGSSMSLLVQLSPDAGTLSMDPVTFKRLAELGIALEIDCGPNES